MIAHRLSFICFLPLLCILLTGCGLTLASLEEENNIEFKVNNPNASYFDVQQRVREISNDEKRIKTLGKFTNVDCDRVPEPVGYLAMPRYDVNPGLWRVANIPLELFENHIMRLVENYLLTSDNKYAHCISFALEKWAEQESLLRFAYNENNLQAWFAVEWTATASGMAYSVIRDNPTIDAGTKGQIEAWLNKVVRKQISYPGGPTSSRNNHLYWRGLQATIVGVVTNDNYLFRYGISSYISAINALSKKGSLPLEMARGRLALHYQNFAILPLVYIAEIADRQGYDLYGVNNKGRDLHLAISFLMQHISDINYSYHVFKGLGSQDISFTQNTKRELNWMEPYYERFQDKKVGKYLQPIRPVYHRWSGGNSSLIYYNP